MACAGRPLEGAWLIATLVICFMDLVSNSMVLGCIDLHGELVASDNEEEEAVQYTA